MASLKAVRNGVETRLETIDGLRIIDGSNITPPAAIVTLHPDGIDWHKTFGDGLADWNLRVIVYVDTAYTRSARDRLDDYCDTTGMLSVKAAIEGDKTLGGIVDDLIVRSTGQEDFVVRIGGEAHQYLGAQFDVFVQGS